MKKKYQIFISSTYTDLQEERQAAVQAILEAGHIPAGMELFKAGNASQLQTIYRWIDESDIYLLILGGRYGSLEPCSQKGYTQLEYEYAVSKGIPAFSIVINDELLQTKIEKMGYKNVMEQKYPDKMAAFREIVLSKVVCFASDNKDIELGIIKAINEIAELYSLRGWVREPKPEKNIQTIEDEKIKNKKKYFVNDDCVTCGACMDDCLVNAISYNDDDTKAVIDQNVCIGCGECETVCPIGAIVDSRFWNLDEVFQNN